METFLGFIFGTVFGLSVALVVGFISIDSKERECLATAEYCVFIRSHWVPATVAAPAEQEGQ